MWANRPALIPPLPTFPRGGIGWNLTSVCGDGGDRGGGAVRHAAIFVELHGLMRPAGRLALASFCMAQPRLCGGLVIVRSGVGRAGPHRAAYRPSFRVPRARCGPSGGQGGGREQAGLQPIRSRGVVGWEVG